MTHALAGSNARYRFLLAGLFAFMIVGASGELHAQKINFPVESFGPKKITGTGNLYPPTKDVKKVPLVILVHGTRGKGYRENSWSRFLRKQGYATFILDYFSPRGADGRGRNVPRPPEDVWGAIKALADNPNVDKDRIAVMGFSNGGSVTRSAAELDTAKDTNGILPKAFIMVYGGCHTPIALRDANYKPALLYIVGSKDALVTAETCSLRKDDANSDDVEVMVIDGAYHMFDGDTNRTINHRRWGTVRLEADSGATNMAREKVLNVLGRVFQ